jgi:hypothetical protein
MKNYKFLLVLILTAFTLTALAQEPKLIKHKISAHLWEQYNKTPNKLKDGLYVVTYEEKNIFVRGIYKDDKKTGVWTFYNDKGGICQRYDYIKNKLVYFAIDPQSILKVNYFFPGNETASKDDTILPIKIGGDDYLFYLLFDETKLPNELKSLKNDVIMTYIFSLDENGKLTDWTTTYKNEFFKQTVKNSVKGLPNAAYEFVGAKIKGAPVASQIKMETVISINNMKIRPPYNNTVTY